METLMPRFDVSWTAVHRRRRDAGGLLAPVAQCSYAGQPAEARRKCSGALPEQAEIRPRLRGGARRVLHSPAGVGDPVRSGVTPEVPGVGLFPCTGVSARM